MNNSQAFNILVEHFPRLSKQSTKAVLFLTDPVSKFCSSKDAQPYQTVEEKRRREIFVAYNVSTQSTTVLREL
jgi:hypothetical protein